MICAKANWDFEDISEERVGETVAHDMAARDEEGGLNSARAEGCLYKSVGLSASRGLTVLGGPRVRLLLPFIQRGAIRPSKQVPGAFRIERNQLVIQIRCPRGPLDNHQRTSKLPLRISLSL